MPSLITNFTWALTGEPQEMLVDGGRVLWRGSSYSGERPPSVQNLEGKRLLPSFIDAHCHILPTGLDLQKLNLASCASHEEVLDAVRGRLGELDDHQWLLAVGYDQTQFPNGVHITRDQLDTVSASQPILLRHFNGHAGIANSAALTAAGITDHEADPSGGTFERDASGRMTGVLLEMANEIVAHAVPTPTLDEMVDGILKAGERMSSLGIACASDMMTGRFHLLRELEAYRIAAEKGCKIRTRLYIQWAEMFGPKAAPTQVIKDLISELKHGSCRVAGIKIFADGAIGSATAAIYGSYTGQSAPGPRISKHGKDASGFAPEGVATAGQLIYKPEKLDAMVRTAHEAGYQLAIHSIGDYATDLVMDAFEATGDPRKHRIEHAMLLSDFQIERMAKLGCFCTMQPEFLMRFAHSYRRQLGPEMMASLKRCRSVIDAGIPLSFSSDRPIVPGDPWDGIRTAVNRPEGYDPSENVTLTEALLAYTKEGARANCDESCMGELKAGHFADYQLLD